MSNTNGEQENRKEKQTTLINQESDSKSSAHQDNPPATVEQDSSISQNAEQPNEPKKPKTGKQKAVDKPVKKDEGSGESAPLKKIEFKEFLELKNRVIELKKNLGKMNEEKESWFAKRTEINKKVSESVSRLMASKKIRDEMTDKVKELKKKRDELNTKIKGEIDEVKKLSPQKKEPVMTNKRGRPITPESVKKEIETLEFRVETEALSPNKEKEVMALIKERRKILNNMESAMQSSKKMYDYDKDIKKDKIDANTFHRQMQESAKVSQEKHEDMLKLSKELDELKKQEREADAKFRELKEKYNNLNSELKAKMKDFKAYEKEFEKKKAERKEAKEHKRYDTVNNVIRQKEEDVKDKIARGEKLTTDDLIVLQGMKE